MVETIQVIDARPMPLADPLPDEFAAEVGRLKVLYLSMEYSKFIAMVAGDVVDLRRALRAAAKKAG